MNQLKPLPKNFTPYIVPQPKGVDVIVKAMQARLSTLSWLTKSFARAVFRSHKRDDSNYVFPGVFVANGYDYANMLELDNWGAYSFFVARGTENVLNYQEAGQSQYVRRLDLIVWFDLQQVDKTRQDDFSQEIREELIEKIKTTRYSDGRVVDVTLKNIEDEPEVIFEGFTFSSTDTQFLAYPYGGFRFQFECTYQDAC